MRTLNRLRMLMPFVAAVVFVSISAAQDGKPADAQPDQQRPAVNQQQDIRANVLRQLGLSREQIQQIRRMNAERKPQMEEANKRFRESNRALDEAIYADNVVETDVQARLRDVQLAQAEVMRLRFMNELAVRRMLTPEQLIRFRELRQRFERARESIQNARPLNRERQIDRQNNQQQLRRVIRQDQQRPIE